MNDVKQGLNVSSNWLSIWQSKYWCMKALGLSLLVVSLGMPSISYAAFPGKNGLIAFSSNRPVGSAHTFQIYTMNPDGTDLKQITHVPGAQFFAPVWSPDGKKIAFESNLGNISGHIFQAYSMNADGTDVIQLTHCTTGGGCGVPNWSPDGKKIAFIGANSNISNIGEWFVMNIDGTNVKQLTFASNDQQFLDGSPAKFTQDGKQIMLTLLNLGFSTSTVYAVNVDGTNLRPYTANNFPEGFNGDFKPNDSRIVLMDFVLSNVSNIYIGKSKPFLVGEPSFTPITNADAEQITTDGNNNYASYSPDGRYLVIGREAGVTLANVTGRDEIYIVDLQGPKPYKITAITNNQNSSWNDMEPDWQPLPANGK